MHPVLAAHAGLDQPWVVDEAATATALPGLPRDRARRPVLTTTA